KKKTHRRRPKPRFRRPKPIPASQTYSDTRTGFTGHLYSALLRDGIHTFLDDKEMETGGEVGSECLRGIEESRFSFVVLSKHYASSTWCLEELVHILKCRRERGHGVWPVFYGVDPSDVEECRGSFAEAFAKHEADFKSEMEKGKRKGKRQIQLLCFMVCGKKGCGRTANVQGERRRRSHTGDPRRFSRF
ncbi:Disease resistance protein Roq1, partial [Linum perenne]